MIIHQLGPTDAHYELSPQARAAHVPVVDVNLGRIADPGTD